MNKNIIGDVLTKEQRLAPIEYDFDISARNRLGRLFTEWVRAKTEREAINFFLDLLVSKHGRTIKHYHIVEVKIK